MWYYVEIGVIAVFIIIMLSLLISLCNKLSKINKNMETVVK